MRLPLRIPLLICVVISGYLADGARGASATFDEYFEGLGDVDGVSGFWREADQPDTYLHVQKDGNFTIYRRNGLLPDDVVTSGKDCYVNGGSTLLSRQESDRFMFPQNFGGTKYRYIDLIVGDDPDMMDVVWERPFFGDTSVRYERERGLIVKELSLCG